MRTITLALAVASGLLVTASGSCNDGSQGRMPGRIQTLPGLPRPAPLPPPPPGLPPMPPRSGDFVVLGEMTQGELAEAIGMTRQTIAAIEAGKYSPSLEAAFRIAHAFGVPLEEVFRWDE